MVVSDYRPEWPVAFEALAKHIRGLVGDSALRIDHIGSTSVPGLGAKDIVDLQITVENLDHCNGCLEPMREAGFQRGGEFLFDSFRSLAKDDAELRKRYMREPLGERRVHIHIRELGRFNQCYALLFRDYMRSSASVRNEYEILKRRAAQLFPDSIEGYMFLKDPVLHIIYQAASLWAEKTSWQPDEDYR